MARWLKENVGTLLKALEVVALLWIASSLHDIAAGNDLYLLRYIHDDLGALTEKLDDLIRAINLK